MFNRTLEVKMIKTKKNHAVNPTQPEPQFEAKAATCAQHLDKVLEKAGSAMVTYIVLDTIRKVLVARASR